MLGYIAQEMDHDNVCDLDQYLQVFDLILSGISCEEFCQCIMKPDRNMLLLFSESVERCFFSLCVIK